MLSPVSVVARATVAASLAAALLSAPAADAASPAGIGDPYYPSAGNPGYDVRHYALNVRYRPGSGLLTGDAVVRLKARHRLERLNLDLLLRAQSVTVNGKRARFSQGRHELTITPRRPIAKGHTVDVEVAYRGYPARLRYGGERPFERTATGAIAVGEPNIAAWWFPSNDHPSDKASFGVRLTVPAGFEAVSNGALLGHRAHAGLASWRWRMTQPMATYLAFAAFGQYDLQRGRTGSGLPYVYAWEHGLGGVAKAARTSLRFSPQAVSFLSDVWGRYPFAQLGGVVPAAKLGYALENQTRPVYGRDMFTYGAARSLVVHELAHQWFGDRVSVRRWRDIWLNEGFATYSEWLWQAHRGEIGPQRRLMRLYHLFESGNPFWRLAIGDPGPARLFDDAVYVRGAMTAQALRNRVGDRDFFAITRRWTHAGDGVGSSREFERLAARISGERLGGFFDHWLRSRVKPAPTADNGLG